MGVEVLHEDKATYWNFYFTLKLLRLQFFRCGYTFEASCIGVLMLLMVSINTFSQEDDVQKA